MASYRLRNTKHNSTVMSMMVRGRCNSLLRGLEPPVKQQHVPALPQRPSETCRMPIWWSGIDCRINRPWRRLRQGRAQGTPCRMTYEPAEGHTEDIWPLSMLICAAPPDLTAPSLSASQRA